MVGWEAVLDPGAGGRPDGTAHVHGGVRLSWVPGSHGLLSSAGLASNAGLAVSPGCPAAVLVVLFCRGCCQRRRLGVARPCPASPDVASPLRSSMGAGGRW